MRPSSVAGWLLWALIVFGLFDCGLAREPYRRVEAAFNAGRWPGGLDAARGYLTNDGDVRRYFAYAQAALGRPYPSYFVRTAAVWRQAFAAAEPYHPDEWPTTTPAWPLVPYRDYLVEYPPGLFAVALPPVWLAHDDPDVYVRVFQALMAVLLSTALAVAIGSVRRGGVDVTAGPAYAWAAPATLLLGVVATHRYDAAVALAIAVALSSLGAGRSVAVGVAIGAGVALKGVPVLMVPIVVLYFVRERRLGALARALAGLGLALALVLLPALVFARAGLLETLRYHAARPVQIESTWGAALGLVHAVAPGLVVVEKTFGSTNVAGHLGPVANRISTLATLAGLAAVYFFTWRRLAAAPDGRPELRFLATLEATAAAFAVFIALGKVSSPQYLVWLLPLGLVLSLREGRRARLLVLLAFLALTQLVYPILYSRLGALRPGVCALVLARNALLVAWAILLLEPRRRGQVEAHVQDPGMSAAERV
jgi:hypothetical protein